MEKKKYSINDYTACVSQYFRVGDRVAWLSGTGSKEGVIRWIGRHVHKDSSICAVVEFDELVTKESNICNVFEERVGHGRFIPLGQLLKKGDMEAGDSIVRPRPKPSTQQGQPRPKGGGGGDGRALLDLSEATPSPNPPKNVQNGTGNSRDIGFVDNSNGLGFLNGSKEPEVDLLGSNLILPTPQPLPQGQTKPTNNFWTEMVNITRNLEANPPPQPPSSLSPNAGVAVGSKVVAKDTGFPVYGQVRWLGQLKGELHAGIEFDEPIGHFSGWISGQFLFKCKQNHGLLISLRELRSSSKYTLFDSSSTATSGLIPINNGVLPGLGGLDLDFSQKLDLNGNLMNGFNGTKFSPGKIDLTKFESIRDPRGIKGKDNSCYIDASLISLFMFSEVLDSRLLLQSSSYAKKPDTEGTRLIRDLLINGIVRPLRQKCFCPYESIHKLRKTLLPLNSKLESQFMDVEEFLYILFDKVYNLRGFLSYNSGQTDFLHQIFVANEYPQRITTVGEMFLRSLKTLGDVKLISPPDPCLILQMPRSGGHLINLEAIVPELTLNLGPCLANPQMGGDYKLFAVICAKSSHFVAFVRAGDAPLAPWVYFDSNPSGSIPKVEVLPKMGEWLLKLQQGSLQKIRENFYTFPELLRRLLSDIYICFYSPN